LPSSFIVSVVLLLGGGRSNGLAVDERKFAMDDSGTDGTRDGGEHGRRGKFTRERMQ